MYQVRPFFVLLFGTALATWWVGCVAVSKNESKTPSSAAYSRDLPLPRIEALEPKTPASLKACSHVPECDTQTCFVVNDVCVNADEKRVVLDVIAKYQGNVVKALQTLGAPEGLVSKLVGYIAAAFEYEGARYEVLGGFVYAKVWQEMKVLAVHLNDDGRIDYLIENCSSKWRCMGNGGPPQEVYYSVGTGYRYAELEHGVVFGADPKTAKVYLDTHGSHCGKVGYQSCLFAFELGPDGVKEPQLCKESESSLKAFEIKTDWLEVVNEGRKDIGPGESEEDEL